MKKSLLIVMAVLLVITIGSGHSSEFSGWVHSGDNISAGDEIFMVKTADKEGSAIILTSNNTKRANIVLYLNESKTDLGYTFFYSGRKDENEAKYKKYNITGVYGQDSNFTFNIIIEKLVASASVTRSISSNDIAINDIFNMSITIKNTGDVQLPVSYYEHLPNYYQKNSKLLMLKDDIEREYRGSSFADSISWTGSLNKDETVTLIQELKLVGLTEGSHSIDLNNGTLKFTYLDKGYTVSTKALSPSYYYPLKTTISFKDKSLMVDEESKVEIIFKNRADEEIDITNASVMLSGNAAILNEKELDGWERNKDILQWHGTLEPGRARSANFSFMPTMTGNISLSLGVRSKYMGLQTTESYNSNIEARIDKPNVELNFDATANSNEDVEIGLIVDNTDSGFDFYDLHIDISSPLFDSVHYLYKKLSAGNSVSNNFTFALPWVYSDQDFNIDLYCNYSTSHRESLQTVINRSISVKKIAFDKALNIALTGYNLSKTDNSSGYNELILHFNITASNKSQFQTATIRTEVGKSENTIMLTADDFASNASRVFEQLFKIPKNTSIENMFAYAFVKYRENDSLFYFIDKFSLVGFVFKKAKQTSSSNQQNNLALIVKKEDPFEYMNKKGGSGVKLKMIDINSSKQIVLIAVILFGSFFAVIFFVATMKKKGADGLRNSKMFSFYKNITPTEKIDNSIKGAKMQHMELDKNSVQEFQQLSELAPMPTSNLEILEDYINHSKMAGKPKDKIKQELLKNGWLNDIVEVYLK